MLCPAPTDTPFWDVANGKTTAVFDNIFARKPKDAAKTAYKIYARNKPYMIDGLVYKISINFLRILPVSLSAKIMGIVQGKTKSSNR